MEIRIVLTIAFVHWVADFIKQTDEMAKGKSTSNYWLGKHILAYTLWTLLAWPLLLSFSLQQLLPWVILNGALHFVVDYFTSRASSKLYQKGDIHNFFVVVGFDQFLHLACLLLSFKYLVL